MNSLRFLPAALLAAAATCVFLPALCYAEAPEQNLLANGNFENGTDGWMLANYGKGGTMAMDQGELHDGKPTLRIESAGTLTFVRRPVQVKAHTTYLLSAYVKVQDVHEEGGGGSGGALVMMDQSQYGAQSVHGTTDWQKVTTELNTGDKTEIQVGPAVGWWGCKVSGTGWFSDVSLTELEADQPHDQNAPGGNLIANANFERGTYGWELINFGQDGTMAMDPAVLRNGKPTLRLDAFSEMAFARQVVAVKAHTTYRLSGYIKVKDVQEIAGAGNAGANLIVGSTRLATRAVQGTDDWQEISVEFDTGDKTAVRVGPAVGYYGRMVSGTAWISEMSLTEVVGNERAP